MTDFANIAWWPALAAAVSTMIMGALWYAPFLFGGAWLNAADLTAERIAAQGARGYVVAALAGLVAGVVLAAIYAGVGIAGLGEGARAGLVLGLGVALPFVASIHAMETRPLSLIAIDGGYAVVTLGVMGAILGAWS